MDKILITGGLGFIGHNISVALKDAGFEVVIVDNYSHNINQPWHKVIINQRLDIIKKVGIPVFTADTSEEFQIENIVLEINPDKIIHTAAIPDARLSNLNPSAGFNQNLLATKFLLETIRKNDLKIGQFTYFSSSMIYGDFLSESVNEDAPKDPKGIYGAAKLSSELLIKAYHNLIDLPYTIIRPSALYGPRCINNRVTQVFIEKALKGEPITIQGDGSQKLDFTFIDDFVRGLVITQTHPDAINCIFNLTTGCAEPIGNLVKILNKYFKDLEVIYEPWDKIVPVRGTLTIEKLKGLGFEPQYRIENGYPKYIEWYLDNNDYFKIGVN
ncbi:MAG: NAD-dependent epimerase/dehydratase family protein [Bacteroidetes bacterium]|nr:NAD-dependent epimerase/dehydratase family protein [Bacteroidota bacterium]